MCAGLRCARQPWTEEDQDRERKRCLKQSDRRHYQLHKREKRDANRRHYQLHKEDFKRHYQLHKEDFKRKRQTQRQHRHAKIAQGSFIRDVLKCPVWPYERATRIVATELRRRCADAARQGNQTAAAAALRKAASDFRGKPKGKTAGADRLGILSAAVLGFERRERGDTGRRITWKDKPSEDRDIVNGLRVYKEFESGGFAGTVTDIDTYDVCTQTEVQSTATYRVVYEDGDHEAIYAAEVKKLARAYQSKFPSYLRVAKAGVVSHECKYACGFRGSKAVCKKHLPACPNAEKAKAAAIKAAEIKAEMIRELDGDGLAELLVAAAMGLEPGGDWDLRLPLRWDNSFVLHPGSCNQHPALALGCLYKCLPQAATWDETEDEVKRRLQPIPRERKTACYRRCSEQEQRRTPLLCCIPHMPNVLPPSTA